MLISPARTALLNDRETRFPEFFASLNPDQRYTLTRIFGDSPVPKHEVIRFMESLRPAQLTIAELVVSPIDFTLTKQPTGTGTISLRYIP